VDGDSFDAAMPYEPSDDDIAESMAYLANPDPDRDHDQPRSYGPPWRRGSSLSPSQWNELRERTRKRRFANGARAYRRPVRARSPRRVGRVARKTTALARASDDPPPPRGGENAAPFVERTFLLAMDAAIAFMADGPGGRSARDAQLCFTDRRAP
jgi:hypothetical protein